MSKSNRKNRSIQQPVLKPYTQKLPKRRHLFKEFEEAINTEEYPLSVSKFWFPIDSLKKEASYNEKFQEFVDELKSEYNIVGWKRSRGDGNCYFRAVILVYIEFLMKPYTPVDISIYIGLLHNESFASSSNQELKKKKDTILECLQFLLQCQKEDKVEAFRVFLRFSQEEEFDLALIWTLKMICAEYVFRNQDRPELSHFVVDGVDSIISDILKKDEEVEGMTLIIVPLALNIQVNQYHFFNKLNLNSFPHEASNPILKVDILVKSRGHYDILYDSFSCLKDGYNFDDGSYCIQINEV